MTNGFLLIDKPAGITSFDVVRRVRKLAKTKKVGHTGTLDPDATGLMGVVLGHCTKLANFLVLEEKEYHFSLEFGRATDSGDASGTVIEECAWEHIQRTDIEEILPKFQGVIQQVPPIYSALKVNGKRAYDLARRGEAVTLAARPVEVFELYLDDYHSPDAYLRVRCGSGTYVRSLARDIAIALNSCAHTRAIHRVSVGPFRIEDAVALDDLTAENLPTLLRPPREMLEPLQHYRATERECEKLSFGQRIHVSVALIKSNLVAISDAQDELVAVAEVEKIYPDSTVCLKPKKVLRAR